MQQDDACRVREEHVDDRAYWWNIASARKAIFEEGKGVKSTAVERLLGAELYVPITVCVRIFLIIVIIDHKNQECIFGEAISLWLQLLLDARCWSPAWIQAWCMESSIHSFDPHLDRTWKWLRPGPQPQLSNYCSNIHVLISEESLYLLTRYQQTPMFGRATIRCFMSDASAMKQLTACDFEDLLQVMALSSVQHFLDADSNLTIPVCNPHIWKTSTWTTQ